jgi:hypothetical protein
LKTDATWEGKSKKIRIMVIFFLVSDGWNMLLLAEMQYTEGYQSLREKR